MELVRDTGAWGILRDKASQCSSCPLFQERHSVVFGSGDPASPIWFVGEAPGQEEDKQGLPFVGRSGKLLDQLFGKVGMIRSQVFITNTVKCRPPGNRVPTEEETRACSVYLDGQMSWGQPKVVVVLGNTSLRRILGKFCPTITQARGTFWPTEKGYEVFPVFHPSYLLRNLSGKEGGPLWLTVQDFKKIKERYDLEQLSRERGDSVLVQP